MPTNSSSLEPKKLSMNREPITIVPATFPSLGTLISPERKAQILSDIADEWRSRHSGHIILVPDERE